MLYVTWLRAAPSAGSSSRHDKRSVTEMIRIAIPDDYQNVSLEMADWSPLAGRAAITVFNDHLSNLDDIVARLLPFDVACIMRERTPLPRVVIERLPRLK